MPGETNLTGEPRTPWPGAKTDPRAVPGHVCVVDEVPPCDICGAEGVADVNLGRGWAMVCEDHFAAFGCRTGVGFGQRWVKRDP